VTPIASLLRLVIFVACLGGPAAAQQLAMNADNARRSSGDQQAAPPEQASANGWNLGLDGVVFVTFNHQGGLRGDIEVVSQNWGMAVGTHRLGRGMFAASGMISMEPLTTRGAGYSEILQVGEAYKGLQITDHQHPHDLATQLAASWRMPLGDRSGFTLAGGPRGEAALGPVTFMHRPSSAENPSAPLSHHIFDSTHIATGVVLARLDGGPFSLEGSWFRGREPDENRYNLEVGPLDSWSARLWFRPKPEWLLQASHGFLHEPEQLEPGDQRRTNGSVSWFRERGADFTAFTVALGRNERTYSTVRALLAEFTRHAGRTSVYSRYEDLTVETEILLFPEVVHRPHPGELVDRVATVTAGAVRDVARFHGVSLGVGADVSAYWLPDLLQFTHGSHPVSWRLFVRIRPPSRGPRMWNMTMGQMAEHGAMSGHGGMDHQHDHP